MREILAKRSTLLFIGVSLTLVSIKLLFDYYPGDFPAREQASAFTWTLLGAILAIGLAGFFADASAKLPQPFEDMSREIRGILVAIAVGVVYGFVTIALYMRDYAQDPHGAGAAWVHMALPWSIPFYTFGAIFLEYLLRLGALCIGFWLIHIVILRRRLRLAVFWILNLVVALYEIWPMYAADAQAGDWDTVTRIAIEPLYLSNVFEGWLLLRYGWFTPIVFRLAFYLVWHILFGGLAGPHFGQ